jgi:predicted RNA-binding Zn ribbon-like protein
VTTRFHFFTSRPSLDFCNTGTPDFELLDTPEALGQWLAEAGGSAALLPPSVGDLEAARDLRDALRVGLLEGRTDRVAEVVEAWLAPALVRICVDRETLAPRHEPAERTTRCALVPVALDALDLVRDHPGRVRECASDACPALFLDLSRNRSRRWCSMDLCGSREKARAYYRRRRRG